MTRYAEDPAVDGAYTARYAHVPGDAPLSRYFALLGANDPVCWWLGKADRQSYAAAVPRTRIVEFHRRIPSLGDNGFFIKREVLRKVAFTPETFGSCMCICEDLRRLGHARYWVVAEQSLWHRTGEDVGDYLKRRWRYVHDLYWDKVGLRRWRMVVGLRDWSCVFLFALCSLAVVPHLGTALVGFGRRRDSAWLLHPLVCLALTVLYAVAWLRFLLSRLSFPRWRGKMI